MFFFVWRATLRRFCSLEFSWRQLYTRHVGDKALVKTMSAGSCAGIAGSTQQTDERNARRCASRLARSVEGCLVLLLATYTTWSVLAVQQRTTRLGKT